MAFENQQMRANNAFETQLGWMVRDGAHFQRDFFSVESLLQPAVAMRLVGLDISSELDRRIWEYFCSARVTRIGVGTGDEQSEGSVFYSCVGAHRISKHGEILGYPARRPSRRENRTINGAPAPWFREVPSGLTWGYDPVSVAKIRGTTDVPTQAYGDRPSLVDSFGVNAWLVGTDLILAIAPKKRAPPKRSKVVKVPEGEPGMSWISPEYFDYLSIKGLQQRLKDYRQAVLHGELRELAGRWDANAQEAGDDTLAPGLSISPVWEVPGENPFTPAPNYAGLSDADLERLEEILRENWREPTRVDLLRNFRENVVQNYQYSRLHDTRQKTEIPAVRCQAAGCRTLFDCSDRRRKFCDAHRKGTSEYWATQKQRQRTGRGSETTRA